MTVLDLCRTKQAMALAASHALTLAGAGHVAVALTWVEEAVEQAALEMGFQQEVHQERGPLPVTFSRRRRRPRVHPHLTLAGRQGALWEGRVFFWPASYRTRRYWKRKAQSRRSTL